MSVRSWVLEHRVGLSLLYVPAFIGYFLTTERREHAHETSVRCALDDVIPFREEWLVPYAAWLPYVLGFAGWLAVRDRDRAEYKDAYFTLVGGTALTMVIYEVWPNRQDLQPERYPRENLLTSLVARLQGFDSPSNVCPSLHVYTTLCINDALQSSCLLRHPRRVRAASWAATGAISASTVFLKQHSILDGVAAAGLFAMMKGARRVVWGR